MQQNGGVGTLDALGSGGPDTLRHRGLDASHASRASKKNQPLRRCSPRRSMRVPTCWRMTCSTSARRKALPERGRSRRLRAGELNGLPLTATSSTPVRRNPGRQGASVHQSIGGFGSGGVVGSSWFADPTVHLGADHTSSMVASNVTAAGATLRRSTLLDGAVVGRGSVLDGCLVGPGAVVGADCMLTNVVLGPGAVVHDGERLEGERRPAEDERSA